MKIYFERSGGFAGMHIVFSLDTSLLTPEDARGVLDLINKAKFFDLPSSSPPPQKGSADYFQYRLSVETDERKHTVETTDETIQPSLRPVVDFLMDSARKQKLSHSKLTP